MLIKWNQGVGYENQKTKTRPNYDKANWGRFQEIVMESLTELAAEEVPSKKLFIFTEASKKAASVTIPLRVLKTNETPYMNDEIKCLMKERNLALNRTAWLQKCKEVAEQPTRKALQYRGRLYHRDQAKANAFIQE